MLHLRRTWIKWKKPFESLPDRGRGADAIKIHRTVRVTMAARDMDCLWEVPDLVALLKAEERGVERVA